MKKVIFLIFSVIFVISLQAKESTYLTQTKINQVLKEAYNLYKNDNSGKNADYIKALAKVRSSIFGITIVDTKGNIYEIGDTKEVVSIQSISKVFTAALLMNQRGSEFLRKTIGVNATGLAFNSIMAIELHNGSASNPFVNAGAIQSVSWIKAKNQQDRYKKIKQNMDNFAGRKLELNMEVYKSELADNTRNQAIAKLLQAYGKMGSEPLKTVTTYTKQCSVNVSSHDLAIMSATIANKGINPVTKKIVLKSEYAPKLMAVMATAGLYDNAGEWLFKTGLPAKSGVGGGIIAVVPGKMGIAVVSPPLDKYGNSVRAQKAISYIVKKLHLNPYEN
jgi:glutaminase